MDDTIIAIFFALVLFVLNAKNKNVLLFGGGMSLAKAF